MVRVIRKVDMPSLIKISLVYSLLFGLFFLIVNILVGILDGNIDGDFTTNAYEYLIPLLTFTAWGFIVGAVGGFIWNLTVEITGGLKTELGESKESVVEIADNKET